MANDVTTEAAGAAPREPAQDLADLLQRGKDQIDDDPDKAVELLSEAVRAFEKQYGSNSLECAGPYLYYGIALYEVARNATDALGGTKSAAAKPAGQEACAAGAAAPSSGAAAAAPQEPKAEGEVEDDFRAPIADDGEGDAHGEDEADADEGEEGGEGDKEGGDEEGGEGSPANDDMKLAWEMVELARLVYSKHQPEEHASKLAEAHKTLGDILSEQEKFEEAAECYKQSLEQMQAMQPRSTRRTAEVQYKLSLMLTFMRKPKEALQQTEITMLALEAAVAEQEEKLSALPTDGSGGEAAEEEGAALQATADDLRAVLDELRYNCEGLREEIRLNESLKNSVAGALENFLLKAGAAGLGATGPTDGAAGASSGAASSFGGPSNQASTLQPVSLGVVGRGTKRITLQPSAAAATGAEQQQPVGGQAPAKRTLADLVGSAPGGAVGHVTGADGPASAEAQVEGQQPCKKPRAEEAD